MKRTIKDKFKILTYNVGFIVKGIDAVMTDGILQNDIIWLKHKYHDRYFADPFLLKSNDQYWYVICEELTFWEQKGIISVLKVKKDGCVLCDRKVVIEESTHLSFPFCEPGVGKIMPESSASNEYYVYEIDLDTFEVKAKERILSEGTIDAVAYYDGKTEWLLTGKRSIPSTELYLYKRENGTQFTEVFSQPVLSDYRHARGAGRFFVWNGKLYRPVQDCKGRYGRQTKIMEIMKLSDTGYQAEEHITLNSFENPPFNETMHTFNVYDECIIVDGSKDFVRFPMKILYRKFPWIFKHRKNV